MKDLIVRIVKLPPMRVAYTHAVSKTPEDDASKVLHAWAKSKGFLGNHTKHHFFGYNNPPPSAPDTPYGYECLITVTPDVEAEGEVKIKEIPGGLYAVVRFGGVENMYEMWKYLMKWAAENSEYEFDEENEPGLEELINPLETSVDKYLFDLYLPVKKRK